MVSVRALSDLCVNYYLRAEIKSGLAQIDPTVRNSWVRFAVLWVIQNMFLSLARRTLSTDASYNPRPSSKHWRCSSVSCRTVPLGFECSKMLSQAVFEACDTIFFISDSGTQREQNSSRSKRVPLCSTGWGNDVQYSL